MLPLILILLGLTVLAATAINFLITNAVQAYSPVLMSGFRLILGGSIICGGASLIGVPFPKNLELWRYGVLSVLIFTIPHALIFSALTDKRVNENDVAFLEALTPCLVFLWDLAFHSLPHYGTQFICVLIVILGLVAFLHGNHSVTFDSWQGGHAKILLSAVVLACGLVAMPILLPQPIMIATDWAISFSSKFYDTALLLIFAGLFSLILHLFTLKNLNQLKEDYKVIGQISFWKHVLLLAIIGTVIGWGTGTWLNFENPVYFGIALVLIPITTAVYKFTVQKIAMTCIQVIGATAVVAGVLGLVILKNV